ncbi:MAG: hypothetical protein K0S30_509 [Clostridia bacterium]|jgi:hypothetical protein|nr:hypothetical protein [Clostridia bacterium]
MSIYLIYSIGSINIVLLFMYLIRGIQAKYKKRDKQDISERFIELLKE